MKTPLLFEQLQQQYAFWKRKIYRVLGFKGRTAWIGAPECEAHFAGDGHPESPCRIAVIRDALKKAWLWPLLQKIDAPLVSDIQLARVHSQSYLADLEAKVPAAGSVKISEDTYMNRETLLAARYGAGAAVKAVDMVMRKQAKNAFCAVRPPGHHAHADKAGGFCFLNNIAVAAMHAIAEYRLQRVAVLDFDLHHGDGTESIFQDDARVMFLSCFESPLYPFCGLETRGSNPHIINSPLSAGMGSHEFRDMVRKDWLPRLDAFKPQLILLSAGFDAHRDDKLGHLNLDERDFEWLTKKVMLLANRHAHGRIVSVLEGGYFLPSLAAAAKAHIACLVKASRFF